MRSERRCEWHNKTRRESRATKRSTYRLNTHRRSRATGQHCTHAIAAMVRKRRAPTRDAPTRSDQQRTHISGASSTPQSQLPNAPHSHADPGRQHHEPPNPAHPHQGKTHEQHPEHGKPLYLSSFNQPRATDTIRRAGTKNARTPHTKGAHATLTRQTIARQRPRTQPRGRRQHGKTRHTKGRGRAP